tara:strand:+ start:10157 stop:10693 length:537 start_codon:yes stop_codon:yes gene_type:complete
MNRTNFILVSSVSILVVGGLIYFLVERKRKKRQYTPPVINGVTPVPNGNNLDTNNTNPTRNWDMRTAPNHYRKPVNLYDSYDFPLKRGSGGDKVWLLQKFLNKTGGLAFPVIVNLRIDGKFGPDTEKALRDWQNKENTILGIEGTGTLGQMSEIVYNKYVLGKESIASYNNEMTYTTA